MDPKKRIKQSKVKKIRLIKKVIVPNRQHHPRRRSEIKERRVEMNQNLLICIKSF